MRAPSQRDLDIYKRCVIQRHNQCSVGMDFEISQSRISQVIARVRRWLAQGGTPTDPQIRDHHQRQQLSHSQHKLRLMRIIERATWAMEGELPLQRTTRRRYVGNPQISWDETTREPDPVQLPAMRVLLRAIKALDELEGREPAAAAAEERSEGERDEAKRDERSMAALPLPSIPASNNRPNISAPTPALIPATADRETTCETAAADQPEEKPRLLAPETEAAGLVCCPLPAGVSSDAARIVSLAEHHCEAVIADRPEAAIGNPLATLASEGINCPELTMDTQLAPLVAEGPRRPTFDNCVPLAQPAAAAD